MKTSISHPPSVSSEVLSRAFRAHGGRLAFVPDDAGTIVEACQSDGIAIVGWEVWLAGYVLGKDGQLRARNRRFRRDLPAADGRTLITLGAAVGPRGEGEAWADFVRRSCGEARARIDALDLARRIDPAWHNALRMNFTLASAAAPKRRWAFRRNRKAPPLPPRPPGQDGFIERHTFWAALILFLMVTSEIWFPLISAGDPPENPTFEPRKPVTVWIQVAVFRTADDCTRAYPADKATCHAAAEAAERQRRQALSEMFARNQCEAEFGTNRCEPRPPLWFAVTGSSFADRLALCARRASRGEELICRAELHTEFMREQSGKPSFLDRAACEAASASAPCEPVGVGTIGLGILIGFPEYVPRFAAFAYAGSNGRWTYGPLPLFATDNENLVRNFAGQQYTIDPALQSVPRLR